ncbi:MAG: FmdB family zinc ribbon protein [Nitrospirota bacterium]
MPVYEYECNQCGEVFEVIQRFNDPPVTVCRVCGGSVKKILSPSAFVLKGTGWYVTDYPSESRKKAMESEKVRTEEREKKSDANKPAEVKS